MIYDEATFPGDRIGPSPPMYRKGFADFYCMKYEVSQQLRVDFFHTLTPTQQANLDVTGPDGKNSDAVIRRTVVWSTFAMPRSGTTRYSQTRITVTV